MSGTATHTPRRRSPARMPNPFPPDDIVRLIEHTISSAGLATVAAQFIKSWFESRKARKIKLKKGDFEIEIEGGMSERQIEKTINLFRREAKLINDADMKIILPRGADRRVPLRSDEEGGR